MRRRGLGVVLVVAAWTAWSAPAMSAPIAAAPVESPSTRAPSIAAGASGSAIDAAVALGNLSATTVSTCGQVQLNATLFSRVDATTTLPVSLYVSEPTRGLGRTLVTTYTAIGQLDVNTTSSGLFAAAASGRGPGLIVEMVTPTGTSTVTTPAYVDNCQGTFFPLSPRRMLDTRSGIGVLSAGVVRAGSRTAVDPATIAEIPKQRVTALTVNLTVTDASAAGFVSLYPCGETQPTASNINFAPGRTVANFAFADLVEYPDNGAICVFSSASARIILDVTGYVVNDQEGLPSGGRYTGLTTPSRIFDTRGGTALAPGEVRAVPIAGRGGVPVSGTTAAMVNITAVNAVTEGYLTVFPCGVDLPDTSTVNYRPITATPNATMIGLGTGGAVCVFTPVATDLIVDVMGYLGISGSALVATVGIRTFDSRQSFGKFLANAPASFRGIAQNANALVNITVAEPEGEGYGAVRACFGGLPESSNVNFSANQTVANAAFVRTGPGGIFCYQMTQRGHVIVDVIGYSSTAPRSPMI